MPQFAGLINAGNWSFNDEQVLFCRIGWKGETHRNSGMDGSFFGLLFVCESMAMGDRFFLCHVWIFLLLCWIARGGKEKGFLRKSVPQNPMDLEPVFFRWLISSLGGFPALLNKPRYCWLYVPRCSLYIQLHLFTHMTCRYINTNINLHILNIYIYNYTYI